MLERFGQVGIVTSVPKELSFSFLNSLNLDFFARRQLNSAVQEVKQREKKENNQQKARGCLLDFFFRRCIIPQYAKLCC
jgi:hypothetical protein